MTDKRKLIVAAGYDAITQSYLDLVSSMGGSGVREKYLAVIDELVPAGSRILELGCGAGTPMTRALAERYRVAALDISSNQLALAHTIAPAANCMRGDMTLLPMRDGSCAAVAAFYSPTHVPRDEHPSLLTEIRRVLRPQGITVLTMGSADNPDGYDDNWLGAPMFWSHFDGDTNVALVRDAGFEIISEADELEHEYGVPVRFRWIVARRARVRAQDRRRPSRTSFVD